MGLAGWSDVPMCRPDQLVVLGFDAAAGMVPYCPHLRWEVLLIVVAVLSLEVCQMVKIERSVRGQSPLIAWYVLRG